MPTRGETASLRPAAGDGATHVRINDLRTDLGTDLGTDLEAC